MSADPAYSSVVARELQALIPEAEVSDFGAIEVMLRTSAEELSFLWWATAFLRPTHQHCRLSHYLVHHSRRERGFELALLRVLGVVGWRLGLGPYAEAVTQGLTCGLVGGVIGAIALITIVVLQASRLRWDLKRPPLDVLRSK